MFHHLNIVPGLLAAALLLSAPVQAALPAYSAVKDEAKTVNKYMIVVWAGTDWSPKSREVTRAVEHLAKDSPEPVLWCIQDERGAPPHGVRRAAPTACFSPASVP